jgi:eukaryotic-like serine/threonine-protein kinase
VSESESPETAPIRVPPAKKKAPPPPPAPRAGGSSVDWAPVGRGETLKLPDDLIPGYVLDELLGEGSMGAVFRGRQKSLDRPVAIKILTPRLAKNEAFLKRFTREARAVAKLNHPNVVSGIDVGEAQSYRYFVMEFVEGPTLQQVLDRHGKIPYDSATKIVLQVARALEHATKNGLVHRDVKPANIIISSKTRTAKLCDLGLAKEVDEDGSDTMEGRAIGTPFYISPELARGGRADIRADIYSLGGTYFHAVCGRPPFEGPTPAVIMAKHLTEEFPAIKTLAPKTSVGCIAVIERMLEKDPDDRYVDPTELIADLELVVAGRWKEEDAGEPKYKIKSRRRARRRFKK